MRRRRRRSRLASCMIGTALLGGAALLAQPIATTIHRMVAPVDPAGLEPDRMAAPQGLVEAAPSAVTDTVGELSGPDILLAQPVRTVEARPGDTPLKMLARMGVAPDDAQAAVRTLSTVWNQPCRARIARTGAFVNSATSNAMSARCCDAPGAATE